MENSFFSGSENLYKYLVSIGILMLVLTIYYPLKQKQDLEILKLNLESEMQVLNLEIKENKENLEDLETTLNEKTISLEEKRENLSEIKLKHKENEINQLKTKAKMDEISSRKKYIKIYDKLFWIASITGIILVVFGFLRWISAKRTEDKKLKLETDLLDLKYKTEKEEYDRNHP